MKRIFIILLIILTTSYRLFAQLTGAAQTLYDSAFAQDSVLVNYALDSGAQVLPTPDNNSFYVQWFPTNATPNTTPLIVSLHGSECNAFMEFKSWYIRAKAFGCGIIALQWYRYNTNPQYSYFPDDTLYDYLNSALSAINYPSHKALLHGFSRGSARSYAMVFKDIQSGNNYFCTTISNAGDADLNYPLYASIDSGSYGPNVFSGKHWSLFCGGLDTVTFCSEMADTKLWLQSQGAIVDIFIQDPALGHNGFQLHTSGMYKDSILNNYLQCFNGVLSLNGINNQKSYKVYPNPFSLTTVITTNEVLNNATLTIFNHLGQVVAQTENISGTSIEINRQYMKRGFYQACLTQGNSTIVIFKLLVMD